MNQVPFEVLLALKERATRLRQNGFPAVGAEFAYEIDAITVDGCRIEDRFLLDLAVVTSSVAHAFDKNDRGGFVFQRDFRTKRYLRESITNRVGILQDGGAMLTALGVGRPLSAAERGKFVDMHRNCRACTGHLLPILFGDAMEAFLNAQHVYEIGMSVRQTGFHGLSSYDGTRTYIAQDSDPITVPHELEHNIRCYVATPQEQPRLVSPARDPTLTINGVQCEAGFVSEYHYYLSNPKVLRTVPQELISPFSARWNLTASR
jgi:hypothetical protein